jgi:hypothetical protein
MINNTIIQLTELFWTEELVVVAIHATHVQLVVQ